MAKKHVFICDKCGREEISNDSYSCKGFTLVKIEVKPYEYSSTSRSKDYHICNDCLKKLGIIKEENGKEKLVPGAGDQLYDIIAQIVQETTPV